MLGVRLLSVVLAITGVFTVAAGSHAEERTGGELDGFAIGRVPEGVGKLVSDFAYEWGGVSFASRVWEHERDDGGVQVDLTVAVLRGERIADQDALTDFVIEYYEHDPATWELTPFAHEELLGALTTGHAFWLVEPGTAVSVQLTADRFGEGELAATALGVQPVL